MALQEHNLDTGKDPVSLRGEVGIGNRPPNFGLEIAGCYVAALAEEFVASPKFEDVNSGRTKKPDSSVLGSFRSSVAFTETLFGARNRVDRFTSYEDYSKWFAGHLFESLAWHEISISANGVLLPQAYVADILREVGKVEVFNTDHGEDGTDNTYVPDGFLVKNTNSGPKIVSIYEYTTSTDFQKFYNQIHGFRFTKERLGNLVTDETDLVFVVPSSPADGLEEFESALRRIYRYNRGEDVPFRIMTLPVSRSQFSQFTMFVLNRYVSRDSNKTLGEQIRDRETMLDGLYVGKKARRQELAVRINDAFAIRSPESLGYVGRYIAGYELPVKDFRNVSVVTLPRSSAQSIGEPSEGVWRKVKEE